MSARDSIRKYVQLLADSWTPAHKTEQRVERLYGEVRAEVLYETPLFLAEYEGAESEVHLTLDDARAMCDDIAKAVAGRQCWDWSRDENGVYVQFWTHEDDDRPLHLTGGMVTEVRVQRSDSVKEEETREGESTPQPAGTCGRALSTGKPCPDHPVQAGPFTEASAAFMQIGHTPSLRGLRTELHIGEHPPLIGRYIGAGMRKAEHQVGLLIIEPKLVFEYAEHAEGGDAE